MSVASGLDFSRPDLRLNFLTATPKRDRYDTCWCIKANR